MPREIPERYVILSLTYYREGHKWVGRCSELGTSTFARTLKQCKEELEELVIEHLNALEEVGERANFFQKWDIAIHQTRTPREVTFRVSGEDWARWLNTAESRPRPLLDPRAFPVGMGGSRGRVLVGA